MLKKADLMTNTTFRDVGKLRWKEEVEAMAKEKFPGWLTKAEVSASLGYSERQIERIVAKGDIRQGYKRVPGRRSIAVLHPDDIEKLKAETLPPLPDIPAGPSRKVPLLPARQITAATLLAAMATTEGGVPLHRKLFLNIKEAAAFSGLPKSYLHRLVKEGSLPALRAGGYRIKRSDLEQLG